MLTYFVAHLTYWNKKNNLLNEKVCHIGFHLTYQAIKSSVFEKMFTLSRVVKAVSNLNSLETSMTQKTNKSALTFKVDISIVN